MLTGTVMGNKGYPICIYVFSLLFIHQPIRKIRQNIWISTKEHDLGKKKNMCLSNIGLSWYVPTENYYSASCSLSKGPSIALFSGPFFRQHSGRLIWRRRSRHSAGRRRYTDLSDAGRPTTDYWLCRSENKKDTIGKDICRVMDS